MKSLFFFLFALSFSLKAHVLWRPQSELLALGFRKVETSPKSLLLKVKSGVHTNIYEEHSLSWPIALERPINQFIGNLHQYQTFTNPPYYHGGVDILANKDQPLTTPVSGHIEAGYYSYTDDYFGNTVKFFLPYKKALEDNVKLPWGKEYFELAIIDEQGNRFEFHHVDDSEFPEQIRKKILGDDSVDKFVAAGTVIGKVYDWSIRRKKVSARHIHYNIIHHHGHHLNPFNYSEYVEDTTPPVITNVYAPKKSICLQSPELIAFKEGEAQEVEGEIIVQTIDMFNESVFPKAPVVVQAYFDDGSHFSWDFSQTIVDDFGQRPPLRNVYLHSRCLPSIGSELKASNSNDFYFKIPVPPHYAGKIIITVADQNRNQATKTVFVRGQSI